MNDLSKYTIEELYEEINQRKIMAKPYEPMCLFGYDDCIYDRNYIKHYYPNWYKDLGSPTECDCNGSNYDDEDK